MRHREHLPHTRSAAENASSPVGSSAEQLRGFFFHPGHVIRRGQLIFCLFVDR